MILNLFIFIIGAFVGSFLNVCIYRIPHKTSLVSLRSHCMNCGEFLKGIDMIPILSYFFLKGHCRYCKKPFSMRYAGVEGLTGILFLLTYNLYGHSLESLFLLNFVSIMIVVLFIDLDHMVIPNKIVVYGICTGLILTVYSFTGGYEVYGFGSPYSGLIGMVAGSGFLYIISEVSRFFYKGQSGLGMGDVKIFLVIGLYLGWKLTLLTLWFSFVLGGIMGVFLIVVLKKNRKMSIPFGPFIVTGALIALFWGNSIYQFIL